MHLSSTPPQTLLCIGKHGDVVLPSLSGYVSREMAKAEALLKVIGSRPENLADNFATLLPNASPAMYQRILDLKVRFGNELRHKSEKFALGTSKI